MTLDAIIRAFYRRLNHKGYGSTELVLLDKKTGKVKGTGLFDDENDFVETVQRYNTQCNVYAGRNPRPMRAQNLISGTHRAQDVDIDYVTAISLDIDPIRAKGVSATAEQRELARNLALNIQNDIGGYVDDSGNGAYVWIPFKTPIELTADNFFDVKEKFALWQRELKERYTTESVGTRIDGCYDFSRIKRVIGSYNHKAKRWSSFVLEGTVNDEVRDYILDISLEPKTHIVVVPDIIPASHVPRVFYCLLEWDMATKELWENPDSEGDRSRHDWMLGNRCIEAGIKERDELAAILMQNPHGKYQRDRRLDYVARTVGKLIG